MSGSEREIAVAVSADFDPPEEAFKGSVEWTFAVPDHSRFGAGIYEIRFVRPLTSEEIASPENLRAAILRAHEAGQ